MASLGEAHEPSRLALFYTAVRRFMAEPSSADTTQLLRAPGRKATAQALRQLTPRVYRELRRVAARLMQGGEARADPANRGPGARSVSAADGGRRCRLAGSRAFFRGRRGHDAAHPAGSALSPPNGSEACGRGAPLEIGDRIDPVQCKARELIALDDALEALAQWDPRKAQIVELRFFGGLSVKETAEVVRVSDADTVMRDWQMAKAWLKKELSAQA